MELGYFSVAAALSSLILGTPLVFTREKPLSRRMRRVILASVAVLLVVGLGLDGHKAASRGDSVASTQVHLLRAASGHLYTRDDLLIRIPIQQVGWFDEALRKLEDEDRLYSQQIDFTDALGTQHHDRVYYVPLKSPGGQALTELR